jgi:exodeoxyribonuclease VII small subunit
MTGSKSKKPGAPGEEAGSELLGLSFEEALRELEGVAGKLEGGGVGLEESLRLLQRGMALIGRCEGELSAAESVLEQLIVNEDGELETVRISGN